MRELEFLAYLMWLKVKRVSKQAQNVFADKRLMPKRGWILDEISNALGTTHFNPYMHNHNIY